ncbi:MAG TPA: acyltransferase domain-containing protein [Candidatus Saccharimonadales bacterium]|nr:acyltransferase domain-containing protein [Candidatus Saccharimonadales bacterium]
MRGEEKTAFGFPGQGADYSELVRDLTDENIVGQETADIANEVIGEVSDASEVDVLKLAREGTEDERVDTRNAQIILLAGGAAGAAYLMKKRKINPDFVRGHSAAAFTAAAVGGALALRQAAIAIKERGISMHEASIEHPGGMAAVKDISLERLDTICQNVGAFISNLNSPIQTIIAGPHEALEEAKKKITQAGGKATLFRNWKAGIAHTPHVMVVQERLNEILGPNIVSDSTIAVVKNRDGKATKEAEQIRQDLTAAAEQVRWAAGTETLDEEGVVRHIEVSSKSKRVISNLLKEHDLREGVEIEHISELMDEEK